MSMYTAVEKYIGFHNVHSLLFKHPLSLLHLKESAKGKNLPGLTTEKHLLFKYVHKYYFRKMHEYTGNSL